MFIKPERTTFYVLCIYFRIIYYLYNCVLLFSGFIFSISPSNEYSGLISFRMDWLKDQNLRPLFSRSFPLRLPKALIFQTKPIK